MPQTLTANDRKQLKGLHPDIIRVVERAAAITTVPFKVLEGMRTLARQKLLLAQGATTTLKSRHLTGHAVDLACLDGGKVSWAWPLYHKLAKIIKQAAKDVGVPIDWGGDWRQFKDGPHWQLPWGKYPQRNARPAGLLMNPENDILEEGDITAYDKADPMDPETEHGAATKSVAYAGGGTSVAAALGGEPVAALVEGALQQQYELSSGEVVRIVVALVILAGGFYLAYKKAKAESPT